jgi:hypothetical protein
MMSSRRWPACCLWIMSDSANTVQRPAMLVGAVERRAASLSSSIVMPSRLAWESRKLPVPAAQTRFMAKSTTTPSRTAVTLLS